GLRHDQQARRRRLQEAVQDQPAQRAAVPLLRLSRQQPPRSRRRHSRQVTAVLKLLTLNIWNRQGPWERRLPLIREGVRRLAPDLVGLQEVLHLDGGGPDQAEDVAAGLGYHVVFGRAWAIWGGGLDFGNALLSRWPIVDKMCWELPVVEGSEEHRSLLYG